MNNIKDLLLNNPSLKVYKNTDTETYERVSAAVKENQGYCPCELQKTPETKCPCANFRNSTIANVCHCGRFFKIPNTLTVCLCGSTRFKTQFEYWAEQLTTVGFIVLMPNVFLSKDSTGTSISALKQSLDDIHKAKIAKSDYVVILNVNGYIGESTASEIAFAEELHKPIYYLEDINEEI